MSNPKNPFRSRTWTIGSRHVSNGLTNTTMWPLGPLSTQPTHVGWYSLVPKLVGTEFIMRRCGWSQPSMMTAGSTPLMSEERRRVESLRTHGDPSFLPAPPRSLSSSSHFVFLFHFSTSHFFSFLLLHNLWHIARCHNSVENLISGSSHALRSCVFSNRHLPFHSWSPFLDWSERGIIEVLRLPLIHSAALFQYVVWWGPPPRPDIASKPASTKL